MLTIHPETFEGYGVPLHTQAALMRFVNQGYNPGGFLTAVLCNDLVGALTRADEENSRALKEIVIFVMNELPAAAIGTEENMIEWCRKVREIPTLNDEV